MRGDAKRPVTDQPLSGAARVQPRRLHLGSQRGAPCEVVGLASPASGGHPDKEARTFTRDRGAVAGRAPVNRRGGVGSVAKFIGPAGLAVIAGASNYVAPQATLQALVPAFNYFAAWYLLGVVGFVLVGIETRGRTIEELDVALAGPPPVKA